MSINTPIPHYNVWVIRHSCLAELKSLPKGIYFLIPDDYKSVNKLTAQVNVAFHQRDLSSQSKLYQQLVFDDGCCVVPTVEDLALMKKFGINYFTKTPLTGVVMSGDSIVSGIEDCHEIYEARAMECILTEIVRGAHRSMHPTIRYNALSRQRPFVRMGFYNYVTETLKTITKETAANLLENMQSALYIKGEK